MNERCISSDTEIALLQTDFASFYANQVWLQLRIASLPQGLMMGQLYYSN